MFASMASKITLPPVKIVSKWNEERVLRWLRKVQLDDCIPAFEARHIDGAMLLELTEQKLFTYQDIKIKRRGQIAKCVNECKSQASNAKRIVGTIKHRSKSRTSVMPNGNNDEEFDSDDDFDYDSDFDEDFDEVDYVQSAEASTLMIESSEKSCSDFRSDRSDSSTGTDINGNNSLCPDDKLVSRSLNSSIDSLSPSPNSQRIPSRNVRSPIKRPSNQPPPPPVLQTSPSPNGPVEDYEIPISHNLEGSHSNDRVTPDLPQRKCFPPLNSETYEIITPNEENYEVIECPPSPVRHSEKPVLPPRSTPVSRNNLAPPLPLKPKKFLDNKSLQAAAESFMSLDRPRLPVRNEEESSHDISPLSVVGATILNNFLGRRNSAPSVAIKSNQKSKDSNNSVSTCSPAASILNSPVDSMSSRSSTPEKDGLFVVGCSQFINSAVSPPLSESPILLPRLPPKTISGIPDVLASNMATRPLPPVPQMDTITLPVESQQDICSHPWFHEVEREDAEHQLLDVRETGAFLVRPSKRAGKENPYTVTIFHEGKVFHLNIRLRADNKFALGREKPKEKTFNSVADLIRHHQSDPILLTSRGEPAGLAILRKTPTKTGT